MADMDEEDLFADLYDGEADEPTAPAPTTVKSEPEPAPVKVEAQTEPVQPTEVPQSSDNGDDFNIKTEYDGGQQYAGQGMQGMDMNAHNGGYGDHQMSHSEDRDRPIQIKDDG